VKWVTCCALAVGVSTAFSLPAYSSTVSCGDPSGVFIEAFTVPSGTPTCLSSGTGTVLNTASDPYFAQVLDSTQSGVNGTPTLNVSFLPPVLPLFPNTDGTFSFDPTGYQNFKIGFQFNDTKLTGGSGDSINPDWFIIGLPYPAGSGSFDADLFFGLTPSDAIKYVVLYGEQASVVPLPATLPLFASGLVGVGLLMWRRKRQLLAAVK
jgi:PEP-CTERM motif